MSSVVDIRIQGRVYSLRTQEPADKIQKVVSHVEQKLMELAGNRSVDTVNLMILALLNMAGEQLHLLEQQQLENAQTDELVRRLTAAIQGEIEQ